MWATLRRSAPNSALGDVTHANAFSQGLRPPASFAGRPAFSRGKYSTMTQFQAQMLPHARRISRHC